MQKPAHKHPGLRTFDVERQEDTIQDFESLLGFPCEGLVEAWEWKNKKNRLVTEAFLGKSEAFLKVLESASKLKGLESPVLITGESGTGKELLAHFIHHQEEDKNRPFVAVNCSAIPETLIESELFGHEKGAFTGAIARKTGYFEQANGGDIFLDEIGTLKPDMQVKLLRVLQNKKVRRVGGEEVQLHFRVIAATNENLEERVKEGKFRIDLFHRLSVVPLEMPPLRERREDIAILADFFIKKHKSKNREARMSLEAFEMLEKYPWPGNIRELENLVQRLLILSEGNVFTETDIQGVLEDGEPSYVTKGFKKTGEPLKQYLNISEKEVISDTLRKKKWNISAAAKDLKVSRTTLYKKIKDYHLCKH